MDVILDLVLIILKLFLLILNGLRLITNIFKPQYISILIIDKHKSQYIKITRYLTFSELISDRLDVFGVLPTVSNLIRFTSKCVKIMSFSPSNIVFIHEYYILGDNI